MKFILYKGGNLILSNEDPHIPLSNKKFTDDVIFVFAHVKKPNYSCLQI